MDKFLGFHHGPISVNDDGFPRLPGVDHRDVIGNMVNGPIDGFI